jgi:hypothetical protein
VSTPVVSKYLACAAFDTAGECVTQVWVDAPGFLPSFSIAEGGAAAVMIGIVWLSIAAIQTAEDAVRDD